MFTASSKNKDTRNPPQDTDSWKTTIADHYIEDAFFVNLHNFFGASISSEGDPAISADTDMK